MRRAISSLGASWCIPLSLVASFGCAQTEPGSEQIESARQGLTNAAAIGSTNADVPSAGASAASAAAVNEGESSICEQEPPPSASKPSHTPPAEILKGYVLHKPPALAGTGDARRSVNEFLNWAAGSLPAEREDGRSVIAAASGNDDIARALVVAAEHAIATDHSRALVALSVLGELRNPTAMVYLAGLVRRPPPRTGTVVNGEIVEASALAQLQAKAVHGLAYARTPQTDQFVVDVAAKHSLKHVRAEAIRALLWNNPNDGRRLLSQAIRDEDRILLDRVEHVLPDDEPGSFNKRLESFVAKYPQLQPPPPKRALACASGDQPPAFSGSSSGPGVVP